MMDGRRHSVDIPISKTLVALRRVRSLRDPSTNSMSKFSALVDSLNWETNSSNGISLRFVNGFQEGGPDNNGLLGLENFPGQREELYGGLRKPDPKLFSSENPGFFGNTGLAPTVTKRADGLDYCGTIKEEAYDKKSLSERYCSELRENGLDLMNITPSSNGLEGADSCNGPILGSSHAERTDHTASKWKSRYKNQLKSFTGLGDVVSCVGSPCPSLSDVLLEGSSRSTSLLANEESNAIDHNDRGCGIRCCWSRTPRFRESNLLSDVEDNPLLLGEVGETILSGQKWSWKCFNNEITPYSESPRSLSQKFRPKAFNELVGQNVVARSLLGAISRGRITSFYLFHGPRGTGKTSASRIFAAALNCLSLEEHRPCGLCRECVLFFSGRSRDSKEIDTVRINQTGRMRSLIKHAIGRPVSSRFKVFIIDECHLLRGETWATVLNSLDDLPQHVVFIMITPSLDKLPRSAVSRSQRYHFPKIKDADIASKLGRICVEECLEFDQVALDFIAAKSNGSIRDAEMMLDQLSLLGKRITMSMTYELIGIVSDDELLDLLDLALSSDTSNTVRRARELMRSRIDPMQLISQLANLIMDILAGKCQEGTSEVRRNFFEGHTSEVDLQKLSHALKILSETEKQLRASKNQTTWLTVALLQLSSVESSFLDANDSRAFLRTEHPRGENVKRLVTCACDNNKPHICEVQEDCKGQLEFLWKQATEICQSSSLKNFLRKQGKLSSVIVSQGMAVAELEFQHPDYVSKAEKIMETDCKLTPVYPGLMRLKSHSTSEHGSDQSDCSDFTSEKAMIRDKTIGTCSSDCGSQVSHVCYLRTEAARTLRNREGNVLGIGTITPHRSFQDEIPKGTGFEVGSSKEEQSSCGCQERENQPNCLFNTFGLHKKLRSSEASQMTCLRYQAQNKLALSVPKNTSFEPYFWANDRYAFSSSSNNFNSCPRDEDGLREDSKVHCWGAPTFPLKKAWQSRHRREGSNLVGWVLPCGATK
ncbi:Protein STICHEL-like 2 [Vitis vinifera]|uniref:DNA-directed DNA polymerase n=1 Tax=Vitis vinifera TaxID=29760 RepID=A0A438GSI5_VITVI|nr:Protein STICHEL-like 2 [Vitis vinifera]